MTFFFNFNQIRNVSKAFTENLINMDFIVSETP